MADLTEELILEEPDSFWQSHREKFAWLILILNMLITFYFWKTINNAAYKCLTSAQSGPKELKS